MDEISFLMDSDLEGEEDEDYEEDDNLAEEDCGDDNFDSDFDAIDLGIQERIRQAQHLDDDLEEEEEDDLEDDEDDEDDEDGELSEGCGDPMMGSNHYDADAYRHLPVGSDISALFKFIDAYKPVDIDIDTAN